MSILGHHSHVLDMKVVPKDWQLNYVASQDVLWRSDNFKSKMADDLSEMQIIKL